MNQGVVWWRTAVFLVLVYVAIRIGIPWLAALGLPFKVRAMLLALLPVLGYHLGPLLWSRKP